MVPCEGRFLIQQSYWVLEWSVFPGCPVGGGSVGVAALTPHLGRRVPAAPPPFSVLPWMRQGKDAPVRVLALLPGAVPGADEADAGDDEAHHREDHHEDDEHVQAAQPVNTPPLFLCPVPSSSLSRDRSLDQVSFAGEGAIFAQFPSAPSPPTPHSTLPLSPLGEWGVPERRLRAESLCGPRTDFREGKVK